jgi:general stress protein YciG
MPDRGGSHEQHVKAGQQSHKNEGVKRSQQQHTQVDKNQQGGERGGSGNFKNDPERASEAGRKGGQS